MRKVLKSELFSKIFIESIPKTLNVNGCWIPHRKAQSSGYVLIMSEQKNYYLHRVVLSVYFDIDYTKSAIETRHNTGCTKACFNPEHLKPGSTSLNTLDAVRDKTNYQISKDNCPLCGGQFTTTVQRNGFYKGVIRRHCRRCKRLRRLGLR